jgi:hypothetical protein
LQERIFGITYAFNVGFGALYGPLILHMQAASLHRTIVKEVKGTRHLKLALLADSCNLNHRVTEGVKTHRNK